MEQSRILLVSVLLDLVGNIIFQKVMVGSKFLVLSLEKVACEKFAGGDPLPDQRDDPLHTPDERLLVW